MNKKVFVDCSMCKGPILVGDNYYSIEIGYFKIENSRRTKPMDIKELFI